MRTELEVDGVTVFIEGADDGPAVLFLHGWPDSHRLWDSAVSALESQCRCIRFSLPGFDLSKPSRPASLDAMTALICAILDHAAPEQRVHLVLHDWGCVFGQYFRQAHPDRVDRAVVTDIGDFNTGAFTRSLPLKAKFGVLAYQLWLAIAFKLGPVTPGLANRMTRWMAGALRCPLPPQRIGWQMNYPYAMTWFAALGGFSKIQKIRAKAPLLYLYGLRKPFQFHSPQWLAQIAATPGCAEHGLPANHWVMIGAQAEFNRLVLAFLTEEQVP